MNYRKYALLHSCFLSCIKAIIKKAYCSQTNDKPSDKLFNLYLLPCLTWTVSCTNSWRGQFTVFVDNFLSLQIYIWKLFIYLNDIEINIYFNFLKVWLRLWPVKWLVIVALKRARNSTLVLLYRTFCHDNCALSRK